MQAFVTGATGFLGGYLVPLLIAEGYEVRCLVRETSNVDNLKKLAVELVFGDITKPDSMKAGMKGCSVVFHLAAEYKIGNVNKERMFDINVNGTKNVLKVAQELNIPKIIYCSSVVALGDTKGEIGDEKMEHCQEFHSEYERTKYLAHQEGKKFISDGLPLIIVLPGGVYGPQDPSSIGKLIGDYLKKNLPALVKTRTSFSYVQVEDVTRGIFLAATKGRLGQSYILGGQILTMDELFGLLEKLSGVRPPKITLSLGVVKFMANIRKFLPAFIRKDILTKEEASTIDDITWSFSSAKAKKELGWKPKKIEAGMKETVEWFTRNDQ